MMSPATEVNKTLSLPFLCHYDPGIRDRFSPQMLIIPDLISSVRDLTWACMLSGYLGSDRPEGVIFKMSAQMGGFFMITSCLPASTLRSAATILLYKQPGIRYSYSLPSGNIAIFHRGSNAKYRHMSMIQNKKAGVRHITVTAAQANRRIDNFINRELPGVPKTRIYQMLRRGEVRVNGGRIKQDYRLQAGDRIRIPPVHYREPGKKAIPDHYLVNAVRDSLILENKNIIALNKPAGITVHGGSGQALGVIEVLRYMRPEEEELQLVHRLDRDTSGCLLISKNMDSLRWLHECLRTGRVEKQYIALLKGVMQAKALDVTAPLRKNMARAGERMAAVTEHGKSAQTKIIRLKQFRMATLARVLINTGRTHQIRVHACHIQQPIAGDGKYGDRSFNKKMRKLGLRRLFLHASSLRIPAFPDEPEGLLLEAPLAPELEKVLATLEN